MKRIIILRGNSGSGKTSIAKLLQQRLGRTTMLLSQDTLRREILHVRENTAHPTAELAQHMAHFGWDHGFDTVIIEGIWGANKNGGTLRELISQADESYVYYFDIPFEETLRRHATKPNRTDFGEEEMRVWWKEKDYLGAEKERIINETFTREQIIAQVMDDLVIIEQ